MKKLTLITVSALAIILFSGCSMRRCSQKHPRRPMTMHVHQYDNHSHRAKSRRHVPHKFFNKAKKSQGAQAHQGRRGPQGRQGQVYSPRAPRAHKKRD